MSKQLNKQVNAATTAAPKKHDNSAMKALAVWHKDRAGAQIGQLMYESAGKARAIIAKDDRADIAPLCAAFGSQRKSDLVAVVAATDDQLAEALAMIAGRGKPGIQQVARALKLVITPDAIASPTDAKKYVSTGAKSDFQKATGQEVTAPEKVTVAPSVSKGANKGGGAPAPGHDGWKSVETGLKALIKDNSKNAGAVAVLEQARALMSIAAGMTANG